MSQLTRYGRKFRLYVAAIIVPDDYVNHDRRILKSGSLIAPDDRGVLIDIPLYPTEIDDMTKITPMIEDVLERYATVESTKVIV